VQVLVLDEADRMFDLGFIADIRYILRRMPAPDKRLNLLFSATLSQRVLELAYEHMNGPQLTRIEPDKMTVERIRQVIYYPSNDEKPRLLVGLIKSSGSTRSMVFVNTRRAAEDVEALLRDNGINAEAISGDVPQQKRLRMLRDFHGHAGRTDGTDVLRGRTFRRQSCIQLRSTGPGRLRASHRPPARAGNERAISLGCEEYVITLPEIRVHRPQDPVANVTPRRWQNWRQLHRVATRNVPLTIVVAVVRAVGGRTGGGPRHHGGQGNRPRTGGG
jgi:ATP-dependent RNA helicase RhlB